MINFLKTVFFFTHKSISKNSFSSFLSIFAVGLAYSLILSVISMYHISHKAFMLENYGFNAVLGARSTPEQLVLNSFYHLETSPGNIAYSVYENISKMPGIQLAVPFAMGDNYRGFRIIGTEEHLFSGLKIDEQNFFSFIVGKKFDSQKNQAVFGAVAAKSLNIKLGQIINPYHGLEFDESMKHDQPIEVVGVLRPTQTPMDRLIFIPLNTFYRFDGHVLRGSGEKYVPQNDEEISDVHKEVSSVMLVVEALSLFGYEQKINLMGDKYTFANVARVVPKIMSKLGWLLFVLKVISYLVMLIMGIVLLTGLYHSLEQRKYEFAIMRAMGAKRSFLVSRIVTESLFLTLMGMMLGGLFFALVFHFSAQYLMEKIGLFLSLHHVPASVGYLSLLVLVIGLIAGIIPAVKLYFSEASKYL